MSEIFTREHYEVFNLLSQSKFMQALKYIDRLEAEEQIDSILRTLKAYIYIELQDYVSAEKYFSAGSNKLTYFAKTILKALNRISECKEFVEDSPEEMYECCILSGDYEASKRAGMKLLKSNPIYLVFSLILAYTNNRDPRDEQLLRLTLKKCPVYPNIYILLTKFGILADFTIESLTRVHVKNLTYFYLLKELFLGFRPYRKAVGKLIFGSEAAESEEACIRFFIERFDDWALYEEAVRLKIDMPPTNALNSTLYAIRRYGETAAAHRILSMDVSFECIYSVLDALGDVKGVDASVILIEDMRMHGFDEDRLRLAYEHYLQMPNLRNTKVLLMYLIASKIEENLVLALYISRKMYSSFKVYEVKLVYMFLCRFFCIISEVQRVMGDLEIKNIQHENMAFLWNDICIFLNVKDDEAIGNYLNLHCDEIRKINDYLMNFIVAGKLDHAYDLLHLRERLTSCCIYSEVKAQEIVSSQRETMFSRILGDKCSYMFDKLTVAHEKNTLRIRNIFGDQNTANDICKFLQNNLLDLRKDTEFMQWLKTLGYVL